MSDTKVDRFGELLAAVEGVSAWDVAIVVTVHDDADTSYLEQEGWEDRRAEFTRGDFGFVGVRVRIVSADGVTIESPGLWGIESDSGEDYFRTVAEDVLAELGASHIWNVSTLPVRYF